MEIWPSAYEMNDWLHSVAFPLLSRHGQVCRLAWDPFEV